MMTHLVAVRQVGVGGSELLGNKQKGKDLGYHQIPVEQRGLYHEAEKSQWDEWLKFGSAQPLSPEETAEVRRTVDKSRILRSRYVHRDKNSSLRTPQRPLPVKAKARLVVAGQNCPDCASGKIRVDAPTV